MQKKDIINAVAEQTGVNKVMIGTILEAIIKTMKDALISDKGIYIRGFASITTVMRKPRYGRDIRGRKAVRIPRRRAVRFKPSASLKTCLKEQL